MITKDILQVCTEKVVGVHVAVYYLERFVLYVCGILLYFVDLSFRVVFLQKPVLINVGRGDLIREETLVTAIR